MTCNECNLEATVNVDVNGEKQRLCDDCWSKKRQEGYTLSMGGFGNLPKEQSETCHDCSRKATMIVTCNGDVRYFCGYCWEIYAVCGW